jgi:hypothetical protein
MMGIGLSMAISRSPAGSASFTPLPGATVGYDFIAGVGTSALSDLMDPTHTAAIGPLLTILQGTDISIVLQLKATGSNPTGITWLSGGGLNQVFTPLSDTTWRSRKNATGLTSTLGSGAFSTTSCKLGFSANASGRTGVGNNGTIVTDAQTWVAGGTPIFVNVDTQWSRIDLFPTRIVDATLASFTVL